MVQHGLEPWTLELLAPRSNQLSYKTIGEGEIWTPDLLRAKQTLYPWATPPNDNAEIRTLAL